MSNFDDLGTGSAPKPSRPDYVPKVALVPQTLDELMQRAGPYADAVKAHLEWSAVSAWLMQPNCEPQLAAAELPVRVACLSVILTKEAEEHAAGWPRLSGPAVTPAIYGYSADSQCEADVPPLKPVRSGKPKAVRTLGPKIASLPSSTLPPASVAGSSRPCRQWAMLSLARQQNRHRPTF